MANDTTETPIDYGFQLVNDGVWVRTLKSAVEILMATRPITLVRKGRKPQLGSETFRSLRATNKSSRLHFGQWVIGAKTYDFLTIDL